MISSSLVRVGGGSAAMVGGVLILISAILGYLTAGAESVSQQANTGAFAFVTLLYLLAVILVLGGLVGLYARQSEEAGLLGVVGFLVAFLGTALMVGASWNQAFFTPGLAETPVGLVLLEQGLTGWVNFGFTLTFLLASLGWLVFGVATLLARVYPRPAAVLLIIGALISLIPLSYTEVLLAAAIAWLGFDLLAGRGSPAVTTERRLQ
jgi:hypothetical protein